MVNLVPSLSISPMEAMIELPTPSSDSCFSKNPIPFPVNESEGMQQAWYLYYNEKHQKFIGSYEVGKRFPLEVEEIGNRWQVAAGIPIRGPKKELTLTSVEQRFVDIGDAAERFSTNYPKLFYATTITILTGTVGAALFFSGRIPLSSLFLLRS